MVLVDVIDELRTRKANENVQNTASSADEATDRTSTDTAVSEIQLSGHNIGSVIKSRLTALNCEWANLVGQEYDGASSMRSERVGVASHIKEVAPLADYFHCAMHALNLSCAKVVTVPQIRHAQDIVQRTTTFIGGSAKRTEHFINIVKKNSPMTKRAHLVTLCTTHFVERHVAITVFYDMLEYVVMTLESMKNWQTQETGNQAGLYYFES